MARRMTIRLTRDLLAEGYTPSELAQRSKKGALARVRRGAYDDASPHDPVARHLRLVQATALLNAPAAVVSHLSAAVVHGLPVASAALGRVQLTRGDAPGGKIRGDVHLYATNLELDEVTEAEGVRVTSVVRTVVDVGRTASFEQAVMAGDAALRRGVTGAQLEASLVRATRRPGVAGARRMASFLDAGSESPGESLSRVVLHRAGIAPPTLQLEVRDFSGFLVGRSDFGWEERRTLGEFDGRVKYGRLLKPGQTAADAVYAEKLREDALRDCGWQVVRWTFADLKTPEVLVERLLRAFARGSSQS